MNNIVLSEKGENGIAGSKTKKIVVIVYLYYMKSVDFYIEKIKKLENSVTIFFVSSNNELLESIKQQYGSQYEYVLKDNRGRDVSALLVAMREKLVKYEYLCFLHDKSPKHNFLTEDVDFWIEDLWDNMIFSKKYVDSVIGLLDNEYGLLLPTKPIGKYADAYYIDPWNENFDNVCKLAKQLKLSIDIKKENTDDVSLGTVFWCRTKALKKIFEYDWTYEEFPKEPLPDDGTISHAIERILGFVALDAGYNVATIMNEKYASKLVDILTKKLQNTYSWMWKNVGIKNTYQLENFDKEKSDIDRYFSEKKKVYLYGAGYYGEKYLQRLEYWGYRPDGFVVSDGMLKEDKFCGLPVYELGEIQKDTNYGIIVSTNPDLQVEICNILKEKGYKDYLKAIVL